MVGGISGWQLVILLVIVVLVFGTKRLRNIGSDLGSAIKGFKKGMEDEQEQLGADATPSKTVRPDEREDDPAARPPGSDV